MTDKLTIQINGKEVEAPLEEWEQVSIKLQGIFKNQQVGYKDLTPIYPPPYLHEPWRITCHPSWDKLVTTSE